MTADLITKRKIFFVRHGNTFEKGEEPRYVGFKTDLPLTQFGVEQAHLVGKFFKRSGEVIKTICHGPLMRQFQTAQAIARELALTSITLKEVPQFSELDYGLWEGLTVNEIKEKWPKEFVAWTEKGIWPKTVFSGDEETFRNAIYASLKSIFASENTAEVIVTSNGTLRYIHAMIAGEDKLATPSVSKVATGNICEVLIADSRYQIKKWNAVAD